MAKRCLAPTLRAAGRPCRRCDLARRLRRRRRRRCRRSRGEAAGWGHQRRGGRSGVHGGALTRALRDRRIALHRRSHISRREPVQHPHPTRCVAAPRLRRSRGGVARSHPRGPRDRDDGMDHPGLSRRRHHASRRRAADRRLGALSRPAPGPHPGRSRPRSAGRRSSDDHRFRRRLGLRPLAGAAHGRWLGSLVGESHRPRVRWHLPARTLGPRKRLLLIDGTDLD